MNKTRRSLFKVLAGVFAMPYWPKGATAVAPKAANRQGILDSSALYGRSSDLDALKSVQALNLAYPPVIIDCPPLASFAQKAKWYHDTVVEQLGRQPSRLRAAIARIDSTNQEGET